MQTLPSKTPFLRIGTRGSLLALAQAKQVRAHLAKIHKIDENDIAIEVIKTSGDMIVDRPLSEVGGKGLFTKEIEWALIENKIDLAVHSSKDVATQLPEAVHLSAFLKREDVREAFVSLTYKSLSDLPNGATFGTSSLRRAAQILRQRPDLKIVEFRGNVQTRLQKLEAGVADATLLAYAGLKRLGQSHIAKDILDPNKFMPAPAQGAICIETRINDTLTNERVAPLNDAHTAAQLGAERHYLKALDGSCRTPIGAYASLKGDQLTLAGQVLSLDGHTQYEGEVSGAIEQADEIGTHLAHIIKTEAGDEFFENFQLRL